MQLLAVTLAWRRLRRIRDRRAQVLLGGLILIVGLRMVDLIPNGRWTSLPAFLAGALHGSARAIALARDRRPADRAQSAPAPVAPAPAPAREAAQARPPRLSDTLRRAPRDANG